MRSSVPGVRTWLWLLWATVLLAPVVSGDSGAGLGRTGGLRWGNDAEGGAPYIYHDPRDPDRLVGFEVEFATALCERLGLKSEFVQNNWELLVPALQEGSLFDVIIAGMERTPENRAKMAMSRPYFAFAQQLVVRAGDTHVESLADLSGRSVGVLSASASQKIAEQRGDLEVRIYPDNVNYFRDLELGRIDAVLSDSPIVQVQLAQNPRLRRAGPAFAPGYYAVGVRPGEGDLLRRIDEAIGAMITDGTLRQIYSRHGLWGVEQEGLASWRSEEVDARGPVSVWRQWRVYLPLLLRASITTIWVTCCGMIVAMVLGLVLVLARLYGPLPLRWLAVAYIEVFRGTPLLLQIYFIYFGLAHQLGLHLSAGVAAVVSLGLNYASSEAEHYRGGILAVPSGQMEAGLALGMGRAVVLRRVILPQALRLCLPSVTNDFIAMFKDSSIVSAIALVELTKEYQIRAIDTGDYVGLGLMTAGIYFIISYAASLGARRLERRLHRDPG